MQEIKYWLLNYVFETHFADPDVLFPPDVWAEFKETKNKTTNSCKPANHYI